MKLKTTHTYFRKLVAMLTTFCMIISMTIVSIPLTAFAAETEPVPNEVTLNLGEIIIPSLSIIPEEAAIQEPFALIPKDNVITLSLKNFTKPLTEVKAELFAKGNDTEEGTLLFILPSVTTENILELTHEFTLEDANFEGNIRITVKDNEEGIFTAEFPIFADNAIPSFQNVTYDGVKLLAEGANIFKDFGKQIVATAIDDLSGVLKIEYRFVADGSQASDWIAATLSDAAFVFTAPDEEFNGTVEIRLFDKANNVRTRVFDFELKAAVTEIPDTEAPVIIATPEKIWSSDPYKTGSKFNVKITDNKFDSTIEGSDASEYFTLSLTVNGDVKEFVLNAQGEGTFTLADGTQNVKLIATDKTENTVTFEKTVIVEENPVIPDTEAPVITVTPEKIWSSDPYKTGSKFNVKITDNKFDSTAVDSNASEYFTVKLTTNTEVKVFVLNAKGEGTFTLADGTQNVKLIATDKAGNTATFEKIIDVKENPDTEAPVITVTPEKLWSLNPYKTGSKFNVKITDNKFDSTAVDSNASEYFTVKLTVNGEVKEFVLNNKGEGTFTLADGTQNVKLIATDKAGNTAAFEKIADVQANPILNVNLNGHVPGIWTNREVYVTLTFGNNIPADFYVNDGFGWKSCTSQYVILPFPGNETPMIYTFRAGSEANGVVSQPVLVTIDTKGPTTIVKNNTITVANNSTVKAAAGATKITLSIDIKDFGVGMNKVTLQKDSATPTDITGKVSIDITEKGLYTITATDKLGNVSTFKFTAEVNMVVTEIVVNNFGTNDSGNYTSVNADKTSLTNAIDTAKYISETVKKLTFSFKNQSLTSSQRTALLANIKASAPTITNSKTEIIKAYSLWLSLKKENVNGTTDNLNNLSIKKPVTIFLPVTATQLSQQNFAVVLYSDGEASEIAYTVGIDKGELYIRCNAPEFSTIALIGDNNAGQIPNPPTSDGEIPENPQTSDNNMFTYILTMLAGLGIISTILIKKKNNAK